MYFLGKDAQFPGMGKDLYEASADAKQMFDKANEILGFSITDIMFGEDARGSKTNKSNATCYLFTFCNFSKSIRSVFYARKMVAGHSLGEFSALVSAGYLSFEDGLKLVSKRAMAMQKACEKNPSTMAAVLGLENEVVEKFAQKLKKL